MVADGGADDDRAGAPGALEFSGELMAVAAALKAFADDGEIHGRLGGQNEGGGSPTHGADDAEAGIGKQFNDALRAAFRMHSNYDSIRWRYSVQTLSYFG
ncbi:MAG: hypothetical protein ACK4YQ_02925 [Phenylobacterium sp.]|uniref:hypothetical protein n=1 Tax=Phenylobacterium sp. TaxID=1871053 RepID=UPI00391D9127